MYSINPNTEQIISEFSFLEDDKLVGKIEMSNLAFKSWKMISVKERISLFQNLKELLFERKSKFSKLMADEMGKILPEGEAEIEKCALLCDYYAEVATNELAPKIIESSHKKSEVHYCPQGIIFAIMPWNYPFWQVLRFAIPTLISGNVALLKHAENVGGCALEIEKLFEDAGFPNGVFQNLFISHSQAESLIENPLIRGVTLTGSTGAGRKIASIAGANIKKSVLELGGADAYIIMEDADLEMTLQKITQSRLLNCGQSCIAAKRFIVDKKIHDEFVQGLKEFMGAYAFGDPTDANSQIGPMARKDLRNALHQQVVKTIEAGAKIELGGEIPSRKGFYYPPTIITEVKKGMPAYHEELFGPVATVIKFENLDEAIEIANSTNFGLGGAIFSKDEEKAFDLAVNKIDSGSCFINDFVKSDPRLPFGGVKSSGYGRELSSEGLKEFVNIKTICLN